MRSYANVLQLMYNQSPSLLMCHPLSCPQSRGSFRVGRTNYQFRAVDAGKHCGICTDPSNIVTLRRYPTLRRDPIE